MNKRGQALVIFIIFLPILIGFLALIVDVGFMYFAKIKGDRLLSEAKENNLDIVEYFKINDIDITIENTSNKGKRCVIIDYSIDSIFGVVLGLDTYDIKVSDC